MIEYTVIYERGGDGEENWGDYVPDLPGCTTTGGTQQEAEANIREAIRGHIAALRYTGQPIPEPTIHAGRVAVAA